jgi:hypothetical protein
MFKFTSESWTKRVPLSPCFSLLTPCFPLQQWWKSLLFLQDQTSLPYFARQKKLDSLGRWSYDGFIISSSLAFSISFEFCLWTSCWKTLLWWSLAVLLALLSVALRSFFCNCDHAGFQLNWFFRIEPNDRLLWHISSRALEGGICFSESALQRISSTSALHLCQCTRTGVVRSRST